MRTMPVALSAGGSLGTRLAGEARAEHLDGGAAVGVVQQRAVEPVVAAHELGREQGRRIVRERGRRAFLRDNTAFEQNDTVGDGHGLDLIVRHMNRRQAERYDQGTQPARASSRNLASRLDKGSSSRITGGVVDQRTGNGDALLLTAGQLVRKAFGKMARRPDLVERLRHPRLNLGAGVLRSFSAVGDVCRTPNGAATARKTGTPAPSPRFSAGRLVVPRAAS